MHRAGDRVAGPRAKIAGLRQIHALALNRLDNETGDVAFLQFFFQRIQIVEWNRSAVRQKRPEAFVKIIIAFESDEAGIGKTDSDNLIRTF